MKLLIFTSLTFYLFQSGIACAASILLPRTGQITIYAVGDDGALQKGLAWPSPRFINNNNGTVTDNLTGLIWLKNAKCTEFVGAIPGNPIAWENAVTWSNALSSGKCGLSDGSSAGQWRLPNVYELESLVDIERVNPALSSEHPFTGVVISNAGGYWSSSSSSEGKGGWVVNMGVGSVGFMDKTTYYNLAWPVRGGQ